MRILAISGSLRAQSTNTFLLKATTELVPLDVEIVFYEGLASLPHFNPDLDSETPPDTVQNFRNELKKSHALLVCSPEYAHGIPGTLKNALDWIVSSGDLDGVPVGLINASPSPTGPTYAQEALKEVLNVLSGKHVIEDAIVSVSAVRTKLDEKGKITDASLREALKSGVNALVKATAEKGIR
ncbi:NADPH-dependent FMN reductase [Bdellovibrio sp. BCCA]|uniref:NADPH-dependent FMN reductase n=1 Tax=Bdellovibrio sp. BCCA TaxID=3136281 RepID=UPI0030F02997